VIKKALAATQRVGVMASEEDDDALEVRSALSRPGGSFAAVFDPLDGSRNIDASIPTGTILGLYAVEPGERLRAVQTL
jgi:fructose-1,6-bisphosphatase I